MTEAISVSKIAQLIQLSIGPVFLLAGVGAILNVLATRLARIVDRVRHLEEAFAGSSSLHQQLARSELKLLGRRMKLANWSITICTTSALCVCLVVAILFIGGLEEIRFGQYIAALFVSPWHSGDGPSPLPAGGSDCRALPQSAVRAA
jgi:hypothetical protein